MTRGAIWAVHLTTCYEVLYNLHVSYLCSGRNIYFCALEWLCFWASTTPIIEKWLTLQQTETYSILSSVSPTLSCVTTGMNQLRERSTQENEEKCSTLETPESSWPSCFRIFCFDFSNLPWHPVIFKRISLAPSPRELLSIEVEFLFFDISTSVNHTLNTEFVDLSSIWVEGDRDLQLEASEAVDCSGESVCTKFLVVCLDAWFFVLLQFLERKGNIPVQIRGRYSPAECNCGSFVS